MSPLVLAPEELSILLANEEQGSMPSDQLFDPEFLSLLGSIDRGVLAQVVTERVCIPGEVIFQEGQHGNEMYIIRSGRVVVMKGSFNDPTILGFRGAGEIVGEMALLEDQPRSASLVAIGDLHLLVIARDRFQEVLENYPFIQKKMMGLLSARLRGSDVERSQKGHAVSALAHDISTIEAEKQHLLELQRIRQYTSDFIVHDLRNPLSVISGSLKMLELVLPENVLEENRELLMLLHSGCDRMQRLVDSILEVSRMEGGEVELVWSKLYPADLVKAAVSTIGPIQKQKMNVVSQVEPDLPIFLADHDRVERVLANLVDNAVKHTPPGGQVTIAAGWQPGQVGKMLEFSVTDTGPGIPAEDRERVFQRFAQVQGEKQRRRGFGLGLTYCRLAVEAHNGNIWVEPGPDGKGSRFAFTLPARLPA